MKYEPLTIHPIGIVSSEIKHRYESPRQGVLATENISMIELFPDNNFEQALQNLEGFERIWVIFRFHLNPNWKPMVTPPRHTRKKVGVFASRSPHRPSQLGLSCVKLEYISGLKIFISESDILDGSPVYDIKPYLPYSDSFPGVRTGWVKDGMEKLFTVDFSDIALAKTEWLKKNAGINLKSFIRLQLEFDPEDDSRKRISRIAESGYNLAYRTWRILYRVNKEKMSIQVEDIRTAYTGEELNDSQNDRYEDKEIHREYILNFGE